MPFHPKQAGTQTGMTLPRGWAWHLLLLLGGAAVLLLLGPYALMLDRSSDPTVATEATTLTLLVDPEDVRSGSELDLMAVWKPANAALSAKYNIGNHAKGLYAPPEMQLSAVVELSANDTAVLVASQVPAVVIFYSSWCGHCRAWAPKFDRMARHFATKYDVLFAGVNCPDQNAACAAHSVGQYPTVRVFHLPNHPDSWGAHGQEVELADEAEALKRLLSAHATQRPQSVLLGQKPSLRGSGEATGGWSDLTARWLEKKLEAKAFAAAPKARLHDGLASLKYLLADEFPVAMSLPKLQAMRTLLRRVLLALPRTADFEADAHALAATQAYLDQLDPAEAAVTIRKDISKLFEAVPWQWKVCGVRGGSGAGAGSVAASFTCGVWQLLHFLSLAPSLVSAQADKDTLVLREDAEALEKSMRDLVKHVFACKVCRDNFLKDYDSCSFGRCSGEAHDALQVDPFLRVQAWLFRLHNGVSTRLYDELEVGPHDQRDRALWPAADSTRGFDTEAVVRGLRSSYWDASWGQLRDGAADAQKLDAYFRSHGGPPSTRRRLPLAPPAPAPAAQ